MKQKENKQKKKEKTSPFCFPLAQRAQQALLPSLGSNGQPAHRPLSPLAGKRVPHFWSPTGGPHKSVTSTFLPCVAKQDFTSGQSPIPFTTGFVTVIDYRAPIKAQEPSPRALSLICEANEISLRSSSQFGSRHE